MKNDPVKEDYGVAADSTLKRHPPCRAAGVLFYFPGDGVYFGKVFHRGAEIRDDSERTQRSRVHISSLQMFSPSFVIILQFNMLLLQGNYIGSRLIPVVASAIPC